MNLKIPKNFYEHLLDRMEKELGRRPDVKYEELVPAKDLDLDPEERMLFGLSKEVIDLSEGAEEQDAVVTKEQAFTPSLSPFHVGRTTDGETIWAVSPSIEGEEVLVPFPSENDLTVDALPDAAFSLSRAVVELVRNNALFDAPLGEGSQFATRSVVHKEPRAAPVWFLLRHGAKDAVRIPARLEEGSHAYRLTSPYSLAVGEAFSLLLPFSPGSPVLVFWIRKDGTLSAHKEIEYTEAMPPLSLLSMELTDLSCQGLSLYSHDDETVLASLCKLFFYQNQDPAPDEIFLGRLKQFQERHGRFRHLTLCW